MKINWTYMCGLISGLYSVFSNVCLSVRRRQWHPTPVLLPRKSHGWRSPEDCSSWGRWESDTTERLHFHFSLSCIGEGNSNPLPCSYLENPRDGGAWWAAVYGVAQSRTWLKWLSSSSLSVSQYSGLPWWFSGKEATYDPWSGIFPGEGNGNPFQCSCLANLMDRRARYGPWGHKSWTWLSF